MRHHFRPPELKLTAILVGLAICLYGCSSSYTVSSIGKPNAQYSYQEVNEELRGRDVKIELKDGGEIYAKEVIVSNDSVTWLDASTTEKTRVATQRIKRVVFKNHLVGGLEGLGIGLGGGSGLGVIVIGATSTHQGEIGEHWVEIGLVLGGGTGTVVGLITGSIIGHSYNYDFPPIDLSDSLQHGK